ncbi:hypothetical protein K9N68_25575 [Kovacikia minuta CCNUW1]|uniref:DALR anticodon-binding domain-containing protein n=1 Tax=Kovacikia minuta TaxID=2931930 RepID=UPI001CCC8166|nr:DALR anticodon-binding domain-containing protein [Kovacikia minuta]UBF24982.1 hypothetical protein K9N68_25575 [Kovacikia minuta CCNUW1]
MLRIRLHQEIYLQKDFLATILSSSPPDGISGNQENLTPAANIPLNRVRDTTRMIYSTGIAHQFAARSQFSVSEIADKVVRTVLRNTTQKEKSVFLPAFDEALQDITGWATQTGLVQFELSDRAIAAWLDRLIHTPLRMESKEKDRETQEHAYPKFPYSPPPIQNSKFKTQNSKLKISPAKIFALQHTHARCCSLLRLAHREGLVTLSQLDSPGIGRLLMPSPIPWLTSETKLLLDSAAERQLISQLFTALDGVSSSAALSSETVFRLAQKVDQAFQAFYGGCPIWGSLKKSTQLAQVRLGLVMVTQRITSLLIEDLLGIYTPLEL